MRLLLTQKMAGVAGAETYYLNLLPALVERGIEASFLIIEKAADRHLNDGFAKQLETAGVPVIRLEFRRSLSWRLIKDIAAIVRAGGYDVVQSNLIHADLWLAATKRLFLPKMTLVSTKHSYAPDYQLQHGLDPKFVGTDKFSIATRLAATQADRLVAISHGLGAFLGSSRLVDPAKIRVIPYGFSFDKVERRLPPGEARFGPLQIISVARLVPVKQHDLLLRAFSAVLPSYPGLKLVLAGGGPEEAKLKGLAQALGVAEAIVWTGFVDNPHDYIRDSDLFVLTSAAEGFGAVILEAWYNGLPVICFDVPAPNEIVTHGSDGFLVEPSDHAQLAKRIDELLGNPELRQKMGQCGRASWEAGYTLDGMVSKTIANYESAIQDRQGAGQRAQHGALNKPCL